MPAKKETSLKKKIHHKFVDYAYYDSTSKEFIECDNDDSNLNDFSNPRVIVFNGAAIPQPRPRARIVQPKGRKPFVHIYNETSAQKEKILKDYLKPLPYLNEHCIMIVLAIYKPLKSWSKVNAERMYGTHKLTKPDSTNIAKFYEDLLQTICMPTDSYVNPGFCIRMYGHEDKTVVAIYYPEHTKGNFLQALKLHFIPPNTLL